MNPHGRPRSSTFPPYDAAGGYSGEPVIPGMKDPGEVDKNVAYSDGKPFPAELLGQLAEHNWPRNYYK
jgi:hypothetical protein